MWVTYVSEVQPMSATEDAEWSVSLEDAQEEFVGDDDEFTDLMEAAKIST